jgi:hypothetical protein
LIASINPTREKEIRKNGLSGFWDTLADYFS